VTTKGDEVQDHIPRFKAVDDDDDDDDYAETSMATKYKIPNLGQLIGDVVLSGAQNALHAAVHDNGLSKKGAIQIDSVLTKCAIATKCSNS